VGSCVLLGVLCSEPKKGSGWKETRHIAARPAIFWYRHRGNGVKLKKRKRQEIKGDLPKGAAVRAGLSIMGGIWEGGKGLAAKLAFNPGERSF